MLDRRNKRWYIKFDNKICKNVDEEAAWAAAAESVRCELKARAAEPGQCYRL